MKKIFLVALMAVFTSSAFAQLITSRTITVNKGGSKVWIDLGAGAFTGDVENSGLGVDLGLRYTHMFSESIGWDILKLSAQTDTKNFTEALDVQLKTGVRYVSPVVFGDQSIYANAALGYGLFTDNTDAHGLAWEVGAGVNITPRFSVGVVYNSQHYSIEDYHKNDHGYNVGLISLRLGIGL